MKTSALASAAFFALALGMPSAVWADPSSAELQEMTSTAPLPPHRPKHIARVHALHPNRAAERLAGDTHVASLGRMVQQGGAYYPGPLAAGSIGANAASYGAAVLLGVGY